MAGVDRQGQALVRPGRMRAPLLAAALLAAHPGVAADAPACPTATTAPPCIGVVGWPASARHYDELQRLEACLVRSISRHAPSVAVVSQRRVRDALYPLLEPETEPATEEAFGQLLVRRDVQLRLEALGLRFVVAYTGGTHREAPKGGVLCGYGGCIGYGWQVEESHLDAALWDLKLAARMGVADAKTQGLSIMPAFVLPVFIAARSLDQACENIGYKMAEQVKAAMRPAAGPPDR
jgi:hypothetical protein